MRRPNHDSTLGIGENHDWMDDSRGNAVQKCDRPTKCEPTFVGVGLSTRYNKVFMIQIQFILLCASRCLNVDFSPILCRTLLASLANNALRSTAGRAPCCRGASGHPRRGRGPGEHRRHILERVSQRSGRPARVVLGRMLAPFPPGMASPTALKCPYHRDRVTRDRTLALRVRAAKSGTRLLLLDGPCPRPRWSSRPMNSTTLRILESGSRGMRRLQRDGTTMRGVKHESVRISRLAGG